jgi:NitT/TauT family transport system substrate-binding protein
MNLYRTAKGMIAAALALAALQISPAQAEPLKIRMAWVVTPASLIPIMFLKEGVAKHLGKTYVVEDVRIGASSQQITAIAANQIDIAALNYSSMSLAVINGNLEDIRILADEIVDGHPGYFSVTYWVRKDSGINRVEDLKGKTLAVNGIGTGFHMALTMIMEKHGMKPSADYTIVEVQFPNMASVLTDKKVDLAGPPTAFTENPAFQAMAKPLFYMKDALGPSTLSFWTARKDYVAKNRAVLVDLIEDYIRAVRWYIDPKNHDEAVELVAKYTKIPAATYKGWLFTNKDFYRDPNALVDMAALQNNIKAAAQQGAIPREITAKNYEDLSLAREAAQRIK